MSAPMPQQDFPSQSSNQQPAGLPPLTGPGHAPERLRKQALLDTGARVAGGASIYAVAWLAICFACNTWATHPWLVLAGGGWMGAWGVHRYWLCKNLHRLVEHQAQWANRWLVRTVLAQGAAWGVLAAICHATPALSSMNVPVMLVGIAMCSTGSASLAIHPKLLFWFPVMMVLPGLMVIAMNDTPGHFLLACLGVFYVGYTLYYASRVVSRDYWMGLHAYDLLEERSRALERASLTDTLTGVSNRMHFNKCYAEEWARAHREGHGLAMLLIDLDHFKSINDGFGHAAGDMVLCEVAQAMQRELLRPGDFVARFGGEEFAVLLPDTDLTGAFAVAERLRRGVAALRLSSDGQPVRITCSVGCAACMPEDTDPSPALIKRADVALYEAKQDGRNRVRGEVDIAEPLVVGRRG
jgi:diguanylate cyclase (GGDEF)-like protein